MLLPARIRFQVLLLALAPFLSSAAQSGELSSTSFLLRGGHVSAGGNALLQSTAPLPRFSASGVSIGQAEAIGFAGSTTDLRSSAPGFWPVVQGDLASLDFDGDGTQAFFDDDDDNDGLLDTVETNTGVFNSAADTGTDPLNPDTDGDGVDDGVEVANGTDPNVADPPPAIPVLPLVGGFLLAAAITWVARRTRSVQ